MSEMITPEQLMLSHVRKIAEIRYQLREEIYDVLPLLPEHIAASLKDKCDRAIAPRPTSELQQLCQPESFTSQKNKRRKSGEDISS